MTRLPIAPWQSREGLPRLLEALGAESGAARYVGGTVRDTLLGLAVSDIDIATTLRPETVITALETASIKAVPTGIAHGTVTAVLPSGPIEITTLRRDVSTDGRRATVAFSDDWAEDAARRDFTINALYADPISGEIHDYQNGLVDLDAGLVRFIGDPISRIAEDHLRILRFFRFHARFGRGAPDEAAITACTKRARDLMALSRERIADELLKLLALANPVPTVRLMHDCGVFAPMLPEIDTAALDRLAALLARETASATAPDPLRRLIALAPQDAAKADGVAARLRLSNAQRKRIVAVYAGGNPGAMELLYKRGAVSAVDAILLGENMPEEAAERIKSIEGIERPVLPISGGVLVEMGLSQGPLVARALHMVERRWIDEDFPDAERAQAIAAETVDQLLREAR